MQLTTLFAALAMAVAAVDADSTCVPGGTTSSVITTTSPYTSTLYYRAQSPASSQGTQVGRVTASSLQPAASSPTSSATLNNGQPSGTTRNFQSIELHFLTTIGTAGNSTSNSTGTVSTNSTPTGLAVFTGAASVATTTSSAIVLGGISVLLVNLAIFI